MSDEAQCTCPEHSIKCVTTGICIEADHMCDGIKDCPDGSDEPESCNLCKCI